MSEKRLIDFETLGRVVNIFKLAPETNLNDVFDELPKPTLADIVGTRTLDSMTEEEIKELVELYAGSPVYTKLVLRDNDERIYVEYLEDGLRRTLHIYLGELSVVGKEIQIFKWFLEKGFNVLGDI